jgi:hypothetical protein
MERAINNQKTIVRIAVTENKLTVAQAINTKNFNIKSRQSTLTSIKEIAYRKYLEEKKFVDEYCATSAKDLKKEYEIVTKIETKLQRLEATKRFLSKHDIVNGCTNNPCVNGGKCIERHSGGSSMCNKNNVGYICQCHGTGFSGTTCSSSISLQPSVFHCDATAGKSPTPVSPTPQTPPLTPPADPGTDVEPPPPISTPHTPKPIPPGGKCYGKCDANADCAETKKFGQFACKCKKGFAGNGYTCDDVNECVDEYKSPCDENAICTNTVGSFNCKCKSGFNGSGKLGDCRAIDVCSYKKPCQNGGVCTSFSVKMTPPVKNAMASLVEESSMIRITSTNKVNVVSEAMTFLKDEDDFTCMCPPGFYGKDCSNTVDKCTKNPCKNGGKCVNTEKKLCECPSGYSGNTCGEKSGEMLHKKCRGIPLSGMFGCLAQCAKEMFKQKYKYTLCLGSSSDCDQVTDEMRKDHDVFMKHPLSNKIIIGTIFCGMDLRVSASAVSKGNIEPKKKEKKEEKKEEKKGRYLFLNPRFS